jgi:transcriptional regulator with XRE-family HTH domain
MPRKGEIAPYNPTRVTFAGRRLHELRVRVGVTMPQLAKESGVPKPVLSRIETGITEVPEWPTMDRVAAAFRTYHGENIQFDYFYPEGTLAIDRPLTGVVNKGRRKLDNSGQRRTVVRVLDIGNLPRPWPLNRAEMSEFESIAVEELEGMNEKDIIRATASNDNLKADGIRKGDRLLFTRSFEFIPDGLYLVQQDNSIDVQRVHDRDGIPIIAVLYSATHRFIKES